MVCSGVGDVPQDDSVATPRPFSLIDRGMVPTEESDESLDSHWAIAVIGPAERAELLAFAEQASRKIVAGLLPDAASLPERLLPLASAYEFAAREWLDLEGLGNPGAAPSPQESDLRRRRIEFGARRAFVLSAPLPLEETDPAGAVYHTLLLGALAEVAGRQGDYRSWLALVARDVFASSDAAAPWDLTLLRWAVELWTEVLDGSGPSGLTHAMELVATIREQRPQREADFLAALDESAEMRARFYLFALFHLTEAATEVLLYRLHGRPADARYRVFVSLSLAREATVGDTRMHPALEWLYEAAARVLERRTPQLELLSERGVETRVH
jgi:hypothetical protein